LPDVATKQGAFLFLVGVILNQNISGELAWRGTARLSDRIDLHPRNVTKYSPDEVEVVLRRTPAIHPFASAMSRAIIEAAERVCRDYLADARLLWQDSPSQGEFLTRMTCFRQIGKHKAEVAMFLLTTVYGALNANTNIDIEQMCPALISYLNAESIPGG